MTQRDGPYLNSALSSKTTAHSLEQWHEILGHCNWKDILKDVVEGMKITKKNKYKLWNMF